MKTNLDKWKEKTTIKDIIFLCGIGAIRPHKMFPEAKIKESDRDELQLEALAELANKPCDEPMTSTIVWHRYCDSKPVGRDGEEFFVRFYDRIAMEEWQEDGFVSNDEIITHWAEQPKLPKDE